MVDRGPTAAYLVRGRFHIAYAAALAEHRAGHHDVVFPPGTYQLYEDGFVFRQEAA